jgi:hypothetical protein
VTAGPIKRPTRIRPVYRGHRGKRLQRNRIRTTDLSAIAGALGITVHELVATARRVA